MKRRTAATKSQPTRTGGSIQLKARPCGKRLVPLVSSSGNLNGKIIKMEALLA